MNKNKGRAITHPALVFRLDYLCQVRELPLKPSLIYPPYQKPNTSIQLASLCCIITGHRNIWPMPHRHEPFLSNIRNARFSCQERVVLHQEFFNAFSPSL